LSGENVPTKPAADGKTYVANEVYCAPDAARMIGNLSMMAHAGVHSADDVLLTASGPGAEMFHGHLDNTDIFRVMATALGLGG
jgi:alkaline phosphatase